ncbi:MAG: NADH-quinone oxidoreductase subunit C [Candidatus Margulisiibacteriota bacterium]
MDIRQTLKDQYRIEPLMINTKNKEESYLTVKHADFIPTCLALHKLCHSPVMLMFAEDKRETRSCYRLNTAFYASGKQHWYYVCLDFPAGDQDFPSLAKEIYSASLFEREIWEMFGIRPEGSPDLRKLRLHEEVWPENSFPLRKDFKAGEIAGSTGKDYSFIKGEGEGLFEVPVGPVHAGIIGPGHFRFSAAGEPIINLEIRLGFTHRGVEKMLEGKDLTSGVKISECVAGDSAFAHSWAFCQAAEKLLDISPSPKAILIRALFLELERLYNHVNDIGGIAMDVGFTFASAFASIMKENIQQLNASLSGSRFLKGINLIGGVSKNIAASQKDMLHAKLNSFSSDLDELEKILFENASFMNRVENTGILWKKTAEDIGIIGLAGRASGIAFDLRQFIEPYQGAGFTPITRDSGDVLARLNVRILESKQSLHLIAAFLEKIKTGDLSVTPFVPKEGFAAGAVEGWRGPVIYWLKLNSNGKIERCKIVDASFHNWEGLAYAVKGEIIPDFPLCNKSFDLSYPGNDL